MKANKIALIIVLIVVLALPALTFNRDPDKILTLENHVVAKDPFHNGVGYQGISELIYYTDEYLKDNIGFRNQAAIAEEAGMFTLFRQMNDPYLLIGKNHNLFTSPADVRDPYKIPQYPDYTEEELAIWADNYKAMDQYYEKAGIPLLFVTVPSKEYVYPELYPGTFLRTPVLPRTVGLVSYLREYAGADAMDLTADLVAAKTDTAMVYSEVLDPGHWNNRGAFLGYQRIMESLRKYDPDLEVLTENDFAITKEIVTKKIPGTNYQYRGFDETLYTYQYKDPSAHPTATLIDSTGLYDVTGTAPGTGPISPEIIAKYGGGIISYYYKNPTQTNGKKLLVLGDSYTHRFLLGYFAESFSELYFAQPHVNGTECWDFVREASDIFAPDMVLYEVVDKFCGIQHMGDGFSPVLE